jgi:hypothetical protein
VPSALSIPSQPSTPPFPPSSLVAIQNCERPRRIQNIAGASQIVERSNECEQRCHDCEDRIEVQDLSRRERQRRVDLAVNPG